MGHILGYKANGPHKRNIKLLKIIEIIACDYSELKLEINEKIIKNPHTFEYLSMHV